jgi:hypothetical protein
MTVRTRAISPMTPEGASPCHGLSHLFDDSPVDADLLPDLLACCHHCHMTRQCARLALEIEGPASSSVSGVWAGVYITSPTQRSGPLYERRLRALAQLQEIAAPSMSATR